MAQRYAIQSDLWRKKMRIRKRAIANPMKRYSRCRACAPANIADRNVTRCMALLGRRNPPRDEATTPGIDQPFTVECSGASSERKQVESLYNALTEAEQKTGEKVIGNLDSFASFVKKKTSELRQQHGCDTVEYSVEMQGGHVKLKAKAKG